ncbi:hypothetical protein [Priestia aryabhattai]
MQQAFDVKKFYFAVNKLKDTKKEMLTNDEKAAINAYLEIVGDMDISTLDPENQRFMTIIQKFF